MSPIGGNKYGECRCETLKLENKKNKIVGLVWHSKMTIQNKLRLSKMAILTKTWHSKMAIRNKMWHPRVEQNVALKY